MKFYLSLFVYLWLGLFQVSGQISLKTELIGNSSFRDKDNKKVGEANGNAQVYEAMMMIPLSVKMGEYERPRIWGVSLFGSYTHLNNKQMDRMHAPDEIMNLSLSVIHSRPISKKWSVLAMVGGGIYTPHTNFSRISGRQIVGNGGVIFVHHFKENLSLGGGLVMNNSFGYPMVFPGLVFEWKLEGKYELDIQLMNAAEIKAGVWLTDYFKLGVTGGLYGSMALEKIDNKQMVFTHQYVGTGVEGLLSLGKGFSLSVVGGVIPVRMAYYQENSLKAFFKDDGSDHDPHFSVSSYGSVSLRYGF